MDHSLCTLAYLHTSKKKKKASKLFCKCASLFHFPFDFLSSFTHPSNCPLLACARAGRFCIVTLSRRGALKICWSASVQEVRLLPPPTAHHRTFQCRSKDSARPTKRVSTCHTAAIRHCETSKRRAMAQASPHTTQRVPFRAALIHSAQQERHSNSSHSEKVAANWAAALAVMTTMSFERWSPCRLLSRSPSTWHLQRRNRPGGTHSLPSGPRTRAQQERVMGRERGRMWLVAVRREKAKGRTGGALFLERCLPGQRPRRTTTTTTAAAAAATTTTTATAAAVQSRANPKRQECSHLARRWWLRIPRHSALQATRLSPLPPLLRRHLLPPCPNQRHLCPQQQWEEMRRGPGALAGHCRQQLD